VHEAGGEAEGEQGRHERRGAQPERRLAEDAIGVDGVVGHAFDFQERQEHGGEDGEGEQHRPAAAIDGTQQALEESARLLRGA
jgi:hypothetical protein